MTRALFAALLVASAAHAAKPKRAVKPPPPAATAPAPAVAPAPLSRTPPALPAPPPAELPTAQVLSQARAALDALEFAQALVLADALVHRPDATRPMQVEGYWLHGQAIAVVADPVEAEPSFRTLFRLEPTFEPAGDPGPKILAVFRKVQVEERRIADELARRAREELVAHLTLTGAGPDRVRGGRPAPFSYRLKDPTGAVDELKVAYRLKGSTAPFSMLALERAEDGQYVGAVPGEVTANEGGAALEYFVEATDAKGRLVGQGDAAAPLTVELTAGRVGRALPRRWLYGACAATGVSSAAMFALGVAALVAWRSHEGLVASSAAPPFSDVSTQQWHDSKETASWLVSSAAIAAGVTLLLVIVTAGLSRSVESPD